MLKRLLLPLLGAVLMIWAVGCSDNPTGTTGDTPSLTDEFGGYTATDEAPAFGDSELLADESEEEEIDDPILSSPSVQELANNVDAGMFHFRAVWGRIPYDSTVTQVTDWTGSLTVSRGAIVIRRLIRFELNQDTYLPRTAKELVEWVSYTTVHNDGIAVDIFVPPVPPTLDSTWIDNGDGDSTLIVDTIPSDPVTLTFETGPYSRTFTLQELASLEEMVALDDGNKVAFHAVQWFHQICPRGVLAGRWGKDEEGNGVFRGLWFSGAGHVVGYLQGHYGQDDQGRNVFYGKWISRDGAFEGFLRGTWGQGPWTTIADVEHQCPGGWFAGRIFDADRNPIGSLSGHYGSAPDYRGGWFQGRWKLKCRETGRRGQGYGVMDDGIATGLAD
jgi:hypothetical protein